MRRSAPWRADATFGRDPNNLTNAYGRLPNDRPHMFRVMGTVDVPRTGVVVGANFQYFSGKPWAATAQVSLPQGDQRILLEPRGTRRLSSQSLLDVRASRVVLNRNGTRVEVLIDLLNVAERDGRGEPGHGQSVQHEFRPADALRGSPPGNGRRAIGPGAVGSIAERTARRALARA